MAYDLKKQPGAAAVRVKVEHVDVDSYGIVHFSRYTSLLETATLNYLAQKDITLPELSVNGIELRVYKIQLKYLKPAYLNDVLFFETRIIKKNWTFVVFEVSGFRETSEDLPEKVFDGEIIITFVQASDNTPIKIPEIIGKHLSEEIKNE